jgi:four helix bundle protein
MADFKKLLVWQKAHAFAVSVTDIAPRIGGPAYSSLRSQLVRAAMSIDANIAEGRGQTSDKSFARFVSIAINSAYEVESHLLMARDTGALNKRDCLMLNEQLIEVRRMLFGLRRQLTSRASAAASLDADSS